jgi:hypothetical protein
VATAADGGRTDFHLARAQTVSALGRVTPIAGVGVLAVVATSALAEPGTLRTVLLAVAWAVAIIGAVLTVMASVRVLRPPLLARLDDDGVHIKVLRGGGPREIAWNEVRTVYRERRALGPCVVIELVGERRSVVPDQLVAESGTALVDALRGRLDRASGQRRISQDVASTDEPIREPISGPVDGSSDGSTKGQTQAGGGGGI